jgi:hypothetical protein
LTVPEDEGRHARLSWLTALPEYGDLELLDHVTSRQNDAVAVDDDPGADDARRTLFLYDRKADSGLTHSLEHCPAMLPTFE